jgi:XTP/dITP diphosphohydrolase
MQREKLLIATTNPGKFREIEEILHDLETELVFLGDLDVPKELDENGKTHEENALLKAKHFHELTGLPTIGEDSGIEIEALGGELGVTTRRWGAGEEASDEDWLKHFMEIMNGKENRNAKFIAVAAYYNGENQELFRGETSGIITEEIEAPVKEGIPLSSVFKPEGSEKVYAALTEAEKGAISHRGKALGKLNTWLTSSK